MKSEKLQPKVTGSMNVFCGVKRGIIVSGCSTQCVSCGEPDKLESENAGGNNG